MKTVKVTNYLGEVLTLELASPEKSGLAVTSIRGIGAGDASISTTELASQDGSKFNSARLYERMIYMDMLFFEIDTETIEETRLKTYQYFLPKRAVTLEFEMETKTVVITGIVQSNEPDVFNKECGVSISIKCPDPYFYSKSTQTTVFSGIEPLLSSPLSNESLTEPLIEMSRILQSTQKVIVYDGDEDVGMIITINATGDVGDLTIHSALQGKYFTLDSSIIATIMGEGIKAGDEIVVDSRRGYKKITLLRDGDITNIRNAMVAPYNWLQMTHGDNVIAYVAASGSQNVLFRVENKIAYGGA